MSRTEFANSVCTVPRVSRSSRFYGSSSLLRYLTMWLRFGVIALAVRSFERRAMSYRSVISNYTRDDRDVFAYYTKQERNIANPFNLGRIYVRQSSIAFT